MKRKINELEARDVGARLRAARVGRGLTLQRIATECSLHYTQVSKIERGMFRFKNKNVQKICKFLGLDFEPLRNTLRSDLHARLDRLVEQRPDAASAIGAIFDALDKLAVS